MTPVIICFGTKNVSGDSLAPEVGSILKEQYGLPVFVYGDLSRPVDCRMAQEAVEHVRAVHPDSVVIAVDACVGKREDVGKIRIRRGGVRPAEALSRGFKAFGDIGVLGIVAQATDNPLSELMTVSPFYVAKLANKIAVLLKYAVEWFCALESEAV